MTLFLGIVKIIGLSFRRLEYGPQRHLACLVGSDVYVVWLLNRRELETTVSSRFSAKTSTANERLTDIVRGLVD